MRRKRLQNKDPATIRRKKPEQNRSDQTTGSGGLFPRMTVEDVFGCLKFRGKPLTIEQMDAAVAREARRRR